MDDGGFDLETRVLCSDGACIGVVGPDGRCKVCAKVYEGDESPVASDVATQVSDEPSREDEGSDAERVCCPDDLCVGIMGQNGVCGTCGKARSL